MNETDTPSNQTRRSFIDRLRVAAVPIGIIATIAVAWIAVGAISSRGAAVAEDAPTPSVTVYEVRAYNIPYAPTYIGRAEASQTVQIRSRIKGFLKDRHFEEGTVVNATQELFSIDRKPFEAEEAVALARVTAAEARLEQARRQVGRYRELFEKQAATLDELERWETEFVTTVSELELLKAELVIAQLILSYTEIASPITGVIGRSLRDTGSLVDDGANSLLAVVEQVDPVNIRFSMSEREMLRWRAMRDAGLLDGPSRSEAEVQITLRNGMTHPHSGKLAFVDVSIDQTTSTVMLLAQAPNPDRSLRPGQSVSVRMLGYERKGIIVVPMEAVLQTPTSASVYVVDPASGAVEARPVTLGEWTENGGWIIEQGLAEGELIAVDNLLRLRPGAVARIGAKRAPMPEPEPPAHPTGAAEPTGDAEPSGTDLE